MNQDSSSEITAYDPGWQWDDHLSLSHAIRSGDHIFVSGQLPVDSSGTLVGRGDLAKQAEQVFDNIRQVLQAAGSDLDRVVRITCYMINFDDYAEYSRVRARCFPDRPPASTTVGINSLLIEGAMLEIDAIARV